MEEKEIRDVFRKNILRLMNEKGFKSNKQVCDASGIDPSRFSKLLSPKETATPTVKDMIVLSKAFGVSVDSLLGLEERNSDYSYNTLLSKASSTPFLFDLFLFLERLGMVSLQHDYVSDSEIYALHMTDRINIQPCDVNLQNALYKWVDYKEKFENDKADYIPGLLDTIEKGLRKELEDNFTKNGCIPVTYDDICRKSYEDDMM